MTRATELRGHVGVLPPSSSSLISAHLRPTDIHSNDGIEANAFLLIA